MELWGPWTFSHVDPFWLPTPVLTPEHHGPHALATGLALETLGMLICEGLWWKLFEGLHVITWEKIETRKLGDLGIKPRSQWWTNMSPTTPPSRCLCKHNNQQIIYVNNNNYAGTQKNARQVWISQSYVNTPSPSSFHLQKYQTNSGGFKPPQTGKEKNSD